MILKLLLLKKQQVNNMKENGHSIIRAFGISAIGVGTLMAGHGVYEGVTHEAYSGISQSATGTISIGVGLSAILLAHEMDPYHRRRSSNSKSID